MQTYKISKGGWSTLQLFNDLTEAQAWADARGPGHTAVLAPDNEQIIQPTAEEIAAAKFERDVDFGHQLIGMFLIENRMLGPYTQQQTRDQKTKFKEVLENLQLGAMDNALNELNDLTVDEFLTLERKNKYITLLTDYINSNA